MANLPSHLFVSDSDGALYDTRVEGWNRLPPLRPNYRRSHREIESVADLKATLRNGAYAWPGGYPLFFITSDSGALAFSTVEKEFRAIADATRDPHDNSGWRVVACDINWEDGELYDDHTGERIESAYAEPDDDETVENEESA